MKSLTLEEALKKHRQMWEAMQKELGDNPSPMDRIEYKAKYIAEKEKQYVFNNCYLCQYAAGRIGSECSYCPIEWSEGNIEDKGWFTTCNDDYLGVIEHEEDGSSAYYLNAPISEILSLPLKKGLV